MDDEQSQLEKQKRIENAIAHKIAKFAHLRAPLPFQPEEEWTWYEEWVLPYYMVRFTEKFAEIYYENQPQITPKVVEKLLAVVPSGWRTRIVAAYFSAMKGYKDFEETFGIYLLQSEFVHAGNGYCIALATFNTPAAYSYFDQYLKFYLDWPELPYDQDIVMSAVAYLDKLNGTNRLDDYRPKWEEFAEASGYFDLERSIKIFSEQMLIVEQVRQNEVKRRRQDDNNVD